MAREKFVSGAKVLAAVPSISQPRRVYRKLYQNEDRLETGGGSSCRLKYRVLEECFPGIENRKCSLFHFCTTGNLVYMLTLFGLLRLIHMIVAKE